MEKYRYSDEKYEVYAGNINERTVYSAFFNTHNRINAFNIR